MKERGQECLMPLIVGQDGILRAGWQPAPGACVRAVPGGLQTRRRLQTCPTTSVEFRFPGKLCGGIGSIKRGGSDL